MSTWDRDRKQRAHYTASCPPLVSDTNKPNVRYRPCANTPPKQAHRGGQQQQHQPGIVVRDEFRHEVVQEAQAGPVRGGKAPQAHLRLAHQGVRTATDPGLPAHGLGKPCPWAPALVDRPARCRPHTLKPFREESLTLFTISPSQSYVVVRSYPVVLESFRRETTSNRPHTQTPSLSLSLSLSLRLL